MWDMFKAELLRFRGWAIAFFAVHLAVLGFMARVQDPAQMEWKHYCIIGGIYVLAGVLFGLYQAGTYRRASNWVNLLHRPLPRLRIAGALFGAGAVLALLAIALPVALVATYQDTMTARVVDLRHWMIPLAAGLVACCGYLAGAYATLGGRRHGWMVLTLPGFFLFSDAGGVGMLAVQALVTAMLATLVAVAFKPDLDAPPRSLPAVLATAVPVQFGAFIVLVLISFGVEMLWVAQGSHPNNIPVPLPGGTREAMMADGRDLMLAGLAESHHPQAPLWREQVALSEVFEDGRGWTALPHRHDMTNRGAIATSAQFTDRERRTIWIFSHDLMRFVGVGSVDRRARGELGIGPDDAPFETPAVVGEGGFLLDAHAVYQFDEASGRIHRRLRLPQGETIAGMPGVQGESLTVLSDRALYLYDARKAQQDFTLLQPRFRIPQPGRIGDLTRVSFIELLDGHLVSFTYESNAHTREGGVPFQQIVHVDGDGKVETVARRALRPDYPPLYRYRTWWLSPLLDAGWRQAARLFAPPAPLTAMDTPPVPRGMLALAGALLLLSALGAAWRTSRLALSAPARWAWVAACAVVGLPALIALWLLYAPRESAGQVPAGAPARLAVA